MKPKLIYSRIGYRMTDDCEQVRVDDSATCDRYKPGDAFVVWAGAPGTGRTIYAVTHVDGFGVWGTVASDTVRELDPSETI